MTIITEELPFRLVEIDDSAGVQGEERTHFLKVGWFQLLATNHKKKGRQFGIPLEHPDYSDEIQETLLSLETDDVVWMKLETEDKRTWLCTGVQPDGEKPV